MSVYRILNDKGECVNRIIADQNFVDTHYPASAELELELIKESKSKPAVLPATQSPIDRLSAFLKSL